MNSRPAATLWFPSRVTPAQASAWGWLGAVGGGLLASAAGLLALRRLAGALQTPLPSATLLTAGAGFAAAVFAMRCLQRPWLQQYRTNWFANLLEFAPSLSVALWAIALGLPGAVSMAVAVFWLVMAGEEIAWWSMRSGFAARRDRSPATPVGSGSVDGQPVAEGAGPNLADVRQSDASDKCDARRQQAEDGQAEDNEAWDARVSQQITRLVDDEGAEVVEAVVREPFVAGQRSMSVHVAFCPPLRRVPEVKAWQLEGPEAAIQLAEVRTFGLRLDLRLRRATEAAGHVLVQFAARDSSRSMEPASKVK